MDQDAFDRLVRKLGRDLDRRRVVGGGLGVAGTAFAAAASDIAATTRAATGTRSTADHPETEDQGCIATGRTCRKKRNGKVRNRCSACCSGLSDGRTCICTAQGGACLSDANCCGGACVDGACGGGPPPACLDFGSSCKGVGRPCCDGLVCASGQGGETDVACYVPKTGSCASTADCVYGMGCIDGRCAPPPPAGLAQPCSLASQQLCGTAEAVCTAYDGIGAPAGTYCTLPLGTTCTGDRDCTCYSCGPENVSQRSRKERRVERLVCCGDAGYPCAADRNCCDGLVCANGQCAYLS